jgi:hypothetical protein
MSVDRFAHGECGAFAVACYQRHAKEGWRLVIFNDELGTPCHAACKTPADVFFDAYGFVSLSDLESRYDRLLFPQAVTEDLFQQHYAESAEAVVLAVFGCDAEDIADAIQFLTTLEVEMPTSGASKLSM